MSQTIPEICILVSLLYLLAVLAFWRARKAWILSFWLRQKIAELCGKMPVRMTADGRQFQQRDGCITIDIVPYNRSVWVDNRVFDLNKSVSYSMTHWWGKLYVEVWTDEDENRRQRQLVVDQGGKLLDFEVKQ